MSTLKVQGNASGTGTTTLQSGNTSSSPTFSLPIADGTANQALVTNGAGVLSFSSVIPFYYANQQAFPSATTSHGALAHSHSDGKMYFAHGGAWVELANATGGGGGGLKSVQVFQPAETSGTDFTGTWTRPVGVTKIRVQLCGGGSSSAGWSVGGGAGGYAEKIIDVTSIASVNVTVGARVLASTGTGGRTTSFGSYLSATGGTRTNPYSGNASGGIGGIGTGGDINIRGGDGAGSHSNGGVFGASSYFGGGSFGQATSRIGDYPAAHGSGGAGCNNGYESGTGARGICIVYEY